MEVKHLPIDLRGQSWGTPFHGQLVGFRVSPGEPQQHLGLVLAAQQLIESGRPTPMLTAVKLGQPWVKCNW